GGRLPRRPPNGPLSRARGLEAAELLAKAGGAPSRARRARRSGRGAAALDHAQRRLAPPARGSREGIVGPQEGRLHALERADVTDRAGGDSALAERLARDPRRERPRERVIQDDGPLLEEPSLHEVPPDEVTRERRPPLRGRERPAAEGDAGEE